MSDESISEDSFKLLILQVSDCRTYMYIVQCESKKSPLGTWHFFFSQTVENF